MNERKDGGPAFPSFDPRLGPSYEPPRGMSLRDYFAAKVMQSLQAWLRMRSTAEGMKNQARYSYEVADAMLAERERGTE